ncbi:MAG: exodeoxyribonuclease VII small subunit [Cognaticolwellia sp.]|jgi:exodeoxyribonuclease VII small subunit|tara:strand:+ start:231 stop:395 length:165 start_codon:yes stop_codon:yes gene_type:complete
MTYEKALEELQIIVAQIENEEISIDELTEKVKRSGELIKYCKEKLRKVEADIEN